jgi:L-amino acid N-acyltransferase YncA
MIPLQIRYASSKDASFILEIYKPFILNSAITFEYTVPSLEDYTQRIDTICNAYPFFVCETEGRVIGYAYASKFRERAAYNWDIETSVYVLEEFQKQGVATLLYERLLDECVTRGFHNAYAVITLPNDKSVNFHARMGFTNIGVFTNTGFKQGAWHSVLFMEKNLIPCDHEPREITRASV